MSHQHGPSCSHHHPVPENGSFHGAFALGIAVNSLFIVAELLAGYYADSLALIADAVHNLGDVMGLVVAWFGYYLSQKKPTARFPSGYGRMSIYTTLINGIFLVIAAGWIIVESLQRLQAPDQPLVGVVIGVALTGVVINLGTAFLFLRGRHDINIHGAMLHMLGDAGISLAVALSAVVIHTTGWLLVDPVLSLAVAAAILWSCWPLLREGGFMALDGIPSSVDRDAIQEYLLTFPDVAAVHDLRIWALSTTKTALSVHIRLAGDGPDTASSHILPALHRGLREKFRLDSVTIQLETTDMGCFSAQ